MSKKTNRPKKFIVDRKKWYRGKGGSGKSALLLERGMKCCLGFVGQQCGVRSLRGSVTPASVPDKFLSRFPKWLINSATNTNSRDCGIAMNINDTGDISDKERESKLKALFKKHGNEIEFVN